LVLIAVVKREIAKGKSFRTKLSSINKTGSPAADKTVR
jgi:hypothetical protein